MVGAVFTEQLSRAVQCTAQSAQRPALMPILDLNLYGCNMLELKNSWFSSILTSLWILWQDCHLWFLQFFLWNLRVMFFDGPCMAAIFVWLCLSTYCVVYMHTYTYYIVIEHFLYLTNFFNPFFVFIILKDCQITSIYLQIKLDNIFESKNTISKLWND